MGAADHKRHTVAVDPQRPVQSRLVRNPPQTIRWRVAFVKAVQPSGVDMKWTVLALALLVFGCDSANNDAEFLDNTYWGTAFVQQETDLLNPGTTFESVVEITLRSIQASGSHFDGEARFVRTPDTANSTPTTFTQSFGGSVTGNDVFFNSCGDSDIGLCLFGWRFDGVVSSDKERLSGTMTSLGFDIVTPGVAFTRQ